MGAPAPKLDDRTAADIADRVRTLVRYYVPEWEESTDGERPGTGKDEIAQGLIGVFARFMEIVIQRLNRVPEKNFLAYLDLLGASPLPPEPARVPLTFSLAAGSVTDGVVPAGTQVAAEPDEGEEGPVIFETERDLVVTAAQLASVFVRDPDHDTFADRSALATTGISEDVSPFRGDKPIEHVLYMGHSDLLKHSTFDLELRFSLPPAVELEDNRITIWEFWDGTSWVKRDPVRDPVDDDKGERISNLMESGSIRFAGIRAIPSGVVDDVENRWLRCRLVTPISPAVESESDTVRASQLPQLETVELTAEVIQTNRTLDAAFANQVPVDLSKDFLPFGDKPKLADTLYLASTEAFGEPGTQVTLDYTLNAPDSVKASDTLALEWEWWDGQAWVPLNPSYATHDEDSLDPERPDERLQQVKKLAADGEVTFRLPDLHGDTQLVINGVDNSWIRVRIASGDYGQEAEYVKKATGYDLEPATFKPPSIQEIKLAYSLTKTATPPELIVTHNDFHSQVVSARPFQPFQPTVDVWPSLYLGFLAPPQRHFPNRAINLFWQIAEDGDGPPSTSERLVLWEYWNGADWTKLLVSDDTDDLARSGIVQFLAPPDIAPRTEFGLERFWLRVSWHGADAYGREVSRILINTTSAVQAVTVKSEILGSSDGSAHQVFRTARRPILLGPVLEVLESETPSAEEQTAIRTEEGDDAVTAAPERVGPRSQVWVRWHEVPDFYGSGPRDRHYVVDHLEGEVRFGDGLAGFTPPLGSGNVRMARYRTGGGTAGNKLAGRVTQLKTSVPYVDKVTNVVPATAGAEAESVEALLDRAPRAVRHRGRAVTFEDYEDLARMVSSEVARVKCIPLYDLDADPDGTKERPGTVSLIIVPRSQDRMPLPSPELRRRVMQSADRRHVPTARLVVAGPDYVRVDVEVEVAIATLEGAGDLEIDILSTLERFLHPLSGGRDGSGWPFGRRPHKSDIYALIEGVPGVDHVRTLTVLETDERTGASATGHFLTYSGEHTVSLVFKES